MTKEEKRLVAKLLNYLQMLETDDNQSLVNEARGIIYELASRFK